MRLDHPDPDMDAYTAWLRANGLDPNLMVDESVQVISGTHIRAELEDGQIVVPLVAPVPPGGFARA